MKPLKLAEQTPQLLNGKRKFRPQKFRPQDIQ